MEPVRIREDVDPKSPEYRRRLLIVIGILFSLTLFGGTCLGYKIRSAENAEAAPASKQKELEQQEKSRALEILREKK